jgi:hypothetical protein
MAIESRFFIAKVRRGHRAGPIPPVDDHRPRHLPRQSGSFCLTEHRSGVQATLQHAAVIEIDLPDSTRSLCVRFNNHSTPEPDFRAGHAMHIRRPE